MVTIDREAKEMRAPLADIKTLAVVASLSMAVLSAAVSAGVAIATTRSDINSRTPREFSDSLARRMEVTDQRADNNEVRIDRLEKLLPQLAEDVRALVRFRCTDDGVTALQLQRAGVDCTRGRQ